MRSEWCNNAQYQGCTVRHMMHSECFNSAQYQGCTVRHMMHIEWCNNAQYQECTVRHIMQMEWWNIYKIFVACLLSIPVEAETNHFNFCALWCSLVHLLMCRVFFIFCELWWLFPLVILTVK